MPARTPSVPARPRDPRLAGIALKVAEHSRLSGEEALELFQSDDLAAAGYLANSVRERLHGNVTTFAVNRHINHSNICGNNCSFCAFRKKEGSPGAARLSPDEVKRKVEETAAPGRTVEVHITGALDPEFTLDDAVRMVSSAREANPAATIKAFTLVEVEYLARKSGKDPKDVMTRLRDAGVSAFPGGGAELFSERIRNKLCPEKTSGKMWLQLAGLAHSLGIMTNATMLFGVGETDRERVDHMLMLREQQDRSRGFMAFIPLLFQKKNTPLEDIRTPSTVEQLKVFSVSRLLLDNIPHIKAHWAMSGLKMAELSQWFGVDDLEGTVVEERIGHEGGAETPAGLPRELVVSLITRSGRTPAERDGLYRAVAP